MKSLLPCAIVALMLGGCATTREEAFVTPDGKPGFIVYCGGQMSSLGKCYERARELCGGDYVLLDQSVMPRVVASNGVTTTTQSRNIQVTCKA